MHGHDRIDVFDTVPVFKGRPVYQSLFCRIKGINGWGS